MTNRDTESARFVLNTWHFLPHYKNELNQLIRFLEDNVKIDIELNSSSPESIQSDPTKKEYDYLTATEVSAYLIASGIDRLRVTCERMAQSNLPMFRLIKKNF